MAAAGGDGAEDCFIPFFNPADTEKKIPGCPICGKFGGYPYILHEDYCANFNKKVCLPSVYEVKPKKGGARRSIRRKSHKSRKSRKSRKNRKNHSIRRK